MFAAAATAAPSWLAPVDLSAPGRDAAEPQVAVDSSGDAIAVWARDDGSHTVIQSATRPAGGAWNPAADLSAPGRDAAEPQVAMDPHGDAAIVWRRFDGFDQIVEGARRSASGASSPPVGLSTAGEDAGDASVKLLQNGTALAVWSRFDGTSTVVQSSLGEPTGTWGPAVDISATGHDASEPQVAVGGSSGNAMAIWTRSDGANTIIQAAGRAPDGPWSPANDLSAPGRNAAEPAIAIDAGGDAVAVWQRSSAGPYTIVQGAMKPAGTPWSAPLDLSAEGHTSSMPRISVDGAGDAVAVWASTVGAPSVIEAAEGAAGGGWTPAARLSELGGGATSPGLAQGLDGDGVTIWSRDDGARKTIQAAGIDSAGPQVRSVSIPPAGTVNQPVAFSIDPFEVWSPIGSIGWSFGDGLTTEGPTVAHIFTTPGIYRVSVTVSDVPGHASIASGAISIFPRARALRNVRVRRGKALLKLHCPSPAGCGGFVKLIARVETERRGRTSGRRLAIAKGGFEIAGPATTTVPLLLSAIGRMQVRRTARKGLKAQLTGPGVKHRVVLILRS